MYDYLCMTGRTILAFITLLVISRILGKQTISNMTLHDFATGITMGAIAANLAFNKKYSTLFLLLCLVVLTVISYTASRLALKFQKTRHWIAGAPTVFIDNGKLLEQNMRSINYTLDSLNQSLREKDVFNLDEVEYAILETNGQLSIKKKEQFLAVTKQDLNIAVGNSNFPIELVMDGKLMNRNLAANHISEEWLKGKIKAKGKEVHDIFYAVKTTNGKLIFDYYKDEMINPLDKE